MHLSDTEKVIHFKIQKVQIIKYRIGEILSRVWAHFPYMVIFFCSKGKKKWVSAQVITIFFFSAFYFLVLF